MKRALITGVAGQDGSYLAELLLDKGYEVHGLVRRTADAAHPNIGHIKQHITLQQSDLSDGNSLRNLIDEIRPDELYNLAAQSHVKVSFNAPVMTSDINALGTLRILDAIHSLKMEDHVRFYQASTSELYGMGKTSPQNELTAFYPGSPYGVAKLYAYWITVNYRESYNMFACNGILFNHESPRRGETFVTRKITRAFARIMLGKQSVLELGNLDSKRDWGHAKDYVRAMWMMLQTDRPDDYVVSTGIQSSIREFCKLAAEYYSIDLQWEGTGINEIGRDVNTGQVLIRVNPAYYRPVDVVNLLGDATKIKETLGWEPDCDLAQLVRDMCESDYEQAKREV